MQALPPYPPAQTLQQSKHPESPSNPEGADDTPHLLGPYVPRIDSGCQGGPQDGVFEVETGLVLAIDRIGKQIGQNVRGPHVL